MNPTTDSGPTGPAAALPEPSARPVPRERTEAGRASADAEPPAPPDALATPVAPVAPARAPAARAELSFAGETTTRFMLGDWLVDVPARRLRRGEQVVSLEPRPMAVLATLCRRPGEVISPEALLSACWPGEAMGDNPVHKVVAGLRKALDDSATAPRYIETIRKQGYRVVAPIGVLSAQGTRSHEGAWRDESPFCGLEPFDEAHAAVFFGRDDAVDALRARLAAQWRRQQPLVVLLGPSGSGKTSLVQAGLLPALRGEWGPGARLAGMTTAGAAALTVCASATVDLATLGELDPWSALAGGLLDWEADGDPLLSGHSIDSLAVLLRERPDEVFRLLRIALEAIAARTTRTVATAAGSEPATPPGPPLLVLDRLEAVLQTGAAMPDGQASRFVATIEQLIGSGLMLVLAVCRNDFYPNLAQHPALMRDKEQGAHMDLAPPDAEALAQMIRLPARAAGLVFGTDASGLNRLDDRLSADAMQAPDALPLLQYTLQSLYLNRDAGEVLSWDAYETMGGLEGAIGRHAEAVLAALPPAQQEALGRLLPRIVSLSAEDATPTSRWAAAASLGDDDERALAQAFVEARLLVSDHVAGATGYRVAHEALLRQWPRVTAWVAQHRATLAVRDEVRVWLQRWSQGGAAPQLLLPAGGLLWQASRAVREVPALFGAEERTFVQQSLDRLRRQRRLRWIGMVAVAVLAAVAALAAVAYARQARLAAERERQSQRLASFMLGDLADQLRPIGKLDLLSRIGEQGVRLLAPADGANESPADVLQRARALVVIGEVNSSRGKGKTDVAIDALEAAQRLLKSMRVTAEVDVGDYYRTLGASAFWLGQIALDAGDATTAMRWFNGYREACEQWRQALPEDANARMEWGYAVNSLGSTAFQQAAWAEAQRWFEMALAQKLEALQRQPRSKDAQEAVAGSELWLGKVALVRGAPRRALTHLDAARSITTDLLNVAPDEVARARDLGAIDLRRADALRAMGEQDQAIAVMTDAVQRIQAVVQRDPDNGYWAMELAHAQASLMLVRAERQSPSDHDIEVVRNALKMAPGSTRSFSRLDAGARLAVAAVEMAAARGQWKAVSALMPEARSQVDVLQQQWPRHWQVHELVGRLGLLELRALRAVAEPKLKARCSAMSSALRPAAESGQGGITLEAWLAARHCEDPDRVDTDFHRRLVADGYVPTQPGLLSP